MSEGRLEALIVAKPGVSKWGLREGVYSLRWGLVAVPPEKIFQITDARR
jgi:hypothetical protein